MSLALKVFHALDTLIRIGAKMLSTRPSSSYSVVDGISQNYGKNEDKAIVGTMT